MRRLLIVLVALAAFTLAPAQVLNPLTRGSIGGIPECKDSRVFCVGKQAGAEFSVVSGSDCAVKLSAPAAGSAVAAAKLASPACSLTNPCTILVGPGVWNECVTLDGFQQLTFRGVGDSTHFEPTVTVNTSVENGVIRIGTVTGTDFATQEIDLSDFSCRNNAFNDNNACVDIGREDAIVGEEATWDRIRITRLNLIANRHAIFIRGNDNIGSRFPQAWISNNILISGSEAIKFAGLASVDVGFNYLWTRTNYCTNPSESAGSTGSLQSGTTSTATLAASEPDDQNRYIRRSITLSEGPGAGTCPAACLGSTSGTLNGKRWIYRHGDGGLPDRVTISPATWGGGCNPTSECDYTISAEQDPNGSPCTDVDWTDPQFMPTSQSLMSNITGVTFREGLQAVLSNETGAAYSFHDNTILVEVNDGGPTGNASADDVTGILLDDDGSDTMKIDTRRNNITVRVRADTYRQSSKLDSISGMALKSPNVVSESVTLSGSVAIRNTGDLDNNVRGVIVDDSATGSAFAAEVPDLFVDITNPGGYTGTSTTLLQGVTAVLKRGQVVSPQPVTIGGTIVLLSGASSTGSATMDFASAAVGTCSATLTMTVPGAADGDSCALGVPNASKNAAGSQFMCWVSAADTVTVSHCSENGTSDPASGTFRATVTRQ